MQSEETRTGGISAGQALEIAFLGSPPKRSMNIEDSGEGEH
jgi:hypothetical protein